MGPFEEHEICHEHTEGTEPGVPVIVECDGPAEPIARYVYVYLGPNARAGNAVMLCEVEVLVWPGI